MIKTNVCGTSISGELSYFSAELILSAHLGGEIGTIRRHIEANVPPPASPPPSPPPPLSRFPQHFHPHPPPPPPLLAATKIDR